MRGGESGWYSVMEFVDGMEFLPFVRSGPDGPGAAHHALAALRQLASGLHALHLAGWVHRDLKSSNVMVERGTGRTVVLDFGLAEALGDPAGRESRRLGTPSHMAPELLQGSPGSPASDWYAFGVMLAQATLRTERPLTDRARIAEELASRIDDIERTLLELAYDLLNEDPSRRPQPAEIFERLSMEAPIASAVRATLAFEGRAVELARITRAWEKVLLGGTFVLEIEGEAGLGKTALVEHFLDRVAREDEGDVFRSRCHVSEQIPFKATDRVVEGIAALANSRRGARTAADEGDATLQSLAELFPALADLRGPPFNVEPEPRLPHAQRRVEAFDQLRRILHGLCETRPVIVFMDDVHWGDADSAQLLRAVIQGAVGSSPKILILWTTRPGSEKSPFLAEARRCKLCEGETFERFSLGNLEAPAAERLAQGVSGSMDAPLLRRIVEESGGNPLLIVKTAARRDGGRPMSSGSLLESLIDDDLHHVALPARNLLNVLAVARLPVALEVAVRAVDGELDVNRAVAALRRANLVCLSSDMEGGADEERLELYHDQLREPILRLVEASARLQLHRSLARSLESSPHPDPGILATHYHAAGDLEPAARHAERAGAKATSAMAFLAAAQHYRNAIAWGEPQSSHRFGLERELADALFNAGHCAESARAYEVARQHSSPGLNHDVAVKAATAWFAAGHVDRGLESIQPLLKAEHISAPPGFLLVPAIAAKVGWLRLRRPMLTLGAGQVDERSARRADLCWSIGQGTSIFLSRTGAFFGVQSLIEAVESGDGYRIGRALAFVGGVCANWGPTASWGEACLGRVETFAEERGDRYLCGWSHVWRANAHLVAGRFEEAIQHAEEGIELIARGPYAMSWESHTARCFSLMARERRGDLAGVAQGASQVLGEARARDDSLRAGRVHALPRLCRAGRGKDRGSQGDGARRGGSLDPRRVHHPALLRAPHPGLLRPLRGAFHASLGAPREQLEPRPEIRCFRRSKLADGSARPSRARGPRRRRGDRYVCPCPSRATHRPRARHAVAGGCVPCEAPESVRGDGGRKPCRGCAGGAGGCRLVRAAGHGPRAAAARRGQFLAEGKGPESEPQRLRLVELGVLEPARWSRVMLPGFA